MTKYTNKDYGDTTSIKIKKTFTHVFTNEKLEVSDNMLIKINIYLQKRRLADLFFTALYDWFEVESNNVSREENNNHPKQINSPEIEKKLDTILNILQSNDFSLTKNENKVRDKENTEPNIEDLKQVLADFS